MGIRTRRQRRLDHRSGKTSGRNSGKRATSPHTTQAEPPPKRSAVSKEDPKENAEHREQTPLINEDFNAWLKSQNLTLETLLAKSVKIGRPTTTKQLQQKIHELSAIVKEFRGAAKFLSAEKNRLTTELESVSSKVQTLEKDLEMERTRSIDKIQELSIQISKVEQKLSEALSYTRSLQSYSADLQSSLSKTNEHLATAEATKLKTLEECVIAKGKNEILAETLKEREIRHKEEAELLQSRLSGIEVGREQDQKMIKHLKSELEKKQRELSMTDADAIRWKQTAEQYREKTGQSVEEMGKMQCSKTALENQYASQNEELEKLRRDIAVCKSQKELSLEHMRNKDERITDLQLQIEIRQTKIDEVEARLLFADKERKRLHNTIQELKGNIRVFCRVRPGKENEDICEPGTENSIIQFPKTSPESGRMGLSLLCPPAPQQPHQQMSFNFDHVFEPRVTQEQVFDEISQLVQSALDGYKVCLFAYGQTGSGKTYTMVGQKECPGIISRSTEQVFTTCNDLEKRGWKFAMHASMIEVYNEEFYDLLSSSPAGGKKRTVTHDAQGNASVSDATHVNVREPDKVEQLLEKALQRRAVGATLINDHSSRSHFLFALKIEGRNAATDETVQGMLNLIDLAGSERVKESGATGPRLKEAQNINKSLSSLGDVIAALSSKADHIPYRNSKLTLLLQPCLGKEAKTLMFVNISPSAEQCHESLSSLRFAAKVNACEIGIAKRNVA